MTAIMDRLGASPMTLFRPPRDEHERATGKATSGGEAGRISTPTPEDLRLINRLTRREYAAEELYVGYCDLANDQVDRSGERFLEKILRQFAKTAPGCAMMGGHDYESLPLGTWYKGEVVKVGDVNWLRCGYYMPITDQNAHARAMLDAGCYRFASIGFNVADGATWDEARLICDICGKDWFSFDCPHWPLESYDVDGEQIVCTLHYEGAWRMVEGSIVYLGCQYDAQFKAGAQARDMHKIEPALLAAMEQQAEGVAFERAAIYQKSWEGVMAPRRKRERPAPEPEAKGAVPYKDEGIVEDREAAWDASAEQAACWDAGDPARYQRMHTWFDAAASDLKGSYKLPHHQNSDMKAVWRGVTAAAGRVQGQTDIPEGDLDGVKAHIARHYQEWGEVAPWVAAEAAPEPEQDSAQRSEQELVSGLDRLTVGEFTMIAERLGMKVGRVLSKANEDKLRACQEKAQAAADGIGEVLAQVAEQAAEEEPPAEAPSEPEVKADAEAPAPPTSDEKDGPLKQATDYLQRCNAARLAAMLTPRR